MRGARTRVGGVFFDAIQEIRTRKHPRDSGADSIVECPAAQPRLLVEGKGRFHVPRSYGAPVGVTHQIRQDLRCARLVRARTRVAYEKLLPAEVFTHSMHVVRPVDRNRPQLGRSRDVMDLLTIAPGRLPNILPFHRPLSPGKSDVVRSGGDSRAPNQPLVERLASDVQIRALHLMVFRTTDRRRKHLSAIHGHHERVRDVVAFQTRVAFRDASDQAARENILRVSRKNMMENGSAYRAERQSVDIAVLAEFAAYD